MTTPSEQYIGADGQAYVVFRESKKDNTPIHSNYNNYDSKSKMTLPELKTLPTHEDIERLIALLRDVKESNLALPIEILERIKKELDDYEI